MKKIYVILLLILCSCNFLAFSQEVNNRKNHPDIPMNLLACFALEWWHLLARNNQIADKIVLPHKGWTLFNYRFVN
jgi:hypothetical protein